MSGKGKQNRETPGVEAPGPIDRALDRDRDDRIDVLEGGERRTARDVAMGEGTEFAAGDEREIRVPVVEEQLSVGKREVDLGEVEIRRRVVEEQQSVPVTLRHEEVEVREVDTPDRPLRAGEEAFQEGTIRVPVRGEEAVVAKDTVVTGEVVVEKDVEVEQRTISDTVRHTEVEFDEHYQKGYAAGSDQRYAGREFEAVEPELRQGYASSGSGDNWARLREQVRTGFNRARGR